MSDSVTALDMNKIMEQARAHVHDAPLPPSAPVAANTNEAPKPEAAHAPTTANINHAPLPEGITAIHGKHTEALGHSTEPMTATKALENAAILYSKAAACFAGLYQDLLKQQANSPQQPQR